MPGAGVVLSSCDGSAAQHWTWAGSTLRINGLCLSSAESAATLEPCGRSGEQWADKGAQLVSVQSGQCLTDPGDSAANGVPVDLEPCDGGVGQRLALPVPSSSTTLTWIFVALVALLLIGLVFLLSLTSTQRRIGRMFSTVRSWFPRRKPRLDPTVAALLADAATSRDAVFAMNHAGRSTAWWPYAAVVADDDVTVWLAGVDVPAPEGLWRPSPGDARAWSANRADLAGARAQSDAGGIDPGICPVVLGILDAAVVVVDVSQACGILVVEGDERLAQQVRASADAQLEGGEVVVRGQGPHPAAGRTHWTIGVDEEGWISIHGRRMKFADTPGLTVLDSVLDDELEPDDVPRSEAGDQTTAIAPDPEAVVPIAGDQAVESVATPSNPVPEPEAVPDVEPVLVEIDTVHEAPIQAIAVSAVSAASADSAAPAENPERGAELDDEFDDDEMVDLRSIAVSAAQPSVDTPTERSAM